MYKTLMTGNLGQDATVNQVGDKKVINFSVAVQVRKDFTQWVDCSYWRNADQSTGVADYLLKGQKVLVEGECSADVWKDVPKLKMNVKQIELLGNERNNNGNLQEASDNPF